MLVLAPGDPGLRVKKAEHLYNGAVFSFLLELLDDEYSPSRLQQALAEPPSNSDDHRPRNLHIIHMALNDYARRKCPKIEPLIRSIDFQALGGQPTKLGMAEVNKSSRSSSLSPRDKKRLTKILAQILIVFLDACVWNEDSTQREKCIKLIMQLDRLHQSAIFTIIQDSEAKVNQEAETFDTDNELSIVSANADDDLAQEAEIVYWRHEADDAKRQAGGLKMRLDRLQDNYDELVRKHEDLQCENEELNKQLESEAGNFDKHRLQRQLRENETLIANLENQRNDLVEQKDRLEREKARLEVQVQKAEHLVDENQELKQKNEELSKKANMADNLRKKVETIRPMEQELKTLQNDKVDVMKAYSDLEKANARIAVMKQEQEAYAAKMEGYEIDIASFRDEKTMWKTENNELRIRIQYLEQQALSDEQTVRDLQDKIQMFDPSIGPETPTIARPSQSLEDELRDSSTSISMRDIELQRLQAENSLLRNSIGTETEKGLLLQELEDVRTSRQQLQDRYNEILEKYTIGQAQIDALILNMGQDGLVAAIDACYNMDPKMKWLMSDYFRDNAYSELRTQVLAEQNVSKELKRQLESTEQALSDKERDLLQARGDCKIVLAELLLNGTDADDGDKVNAVEKSSFDALEELKKTDGMIAVSLRAELDSARKKSKAIKEESDNLQKQLLTAFIEKDQLRRETEEANRKVQAAADGLTPSTDFIKQGEKFEKLRVKAKELKEVSASKSSPTVLAGSTSATGPSFHAGTIELPVSPISDWSDDDEDDDEDGDRDGDGLDGLEVKVKRQTMWQAFRSRASWLPGSPPQSPQRPAAGFHPFEIDASGSFGFPRRPFSASLLRGSPTHGGSSGPAPPRPGTAPSNISKGNRLSSWLGRGQGNSSSRSP